MKSRSFVHFAVLVTLVAASGAACPRTPWQSASPAPVVFQTDPTLQEVIAVVNQNRARVASLVSTRTTLEGDGFPQMRASLAIGSARQLRLRAGTGLTGSELDFGSNDEVFWVWIKRNDPPAIYYGYHDQLTGSPAEQVLPVRPEWLVEALGLVTLDPAGQHQGPIRRPDGYLELRTTVPSPQGELTKLIVLDGRSGWILQQHLYDARRQLVASAYNSQHLVDPVSGATLPRRTEIHWPATEMRLIVKLDDVQINPPQLGADLWTKPEYPGFPSVNITPVPAAANAVIPDRGVPVSNVSAPSASPWHGVP